MKWRLHFNSPVVIVFTLFAFALFLLKNVFPFIDYFFLLKPYFNFSALSCYSSFLGYTINHADLEHLLGNITLFLLIGPVCEERYGSKSFFLMIVLTSIITAVLHILFFNNALLGASGIVFLCIILTSFANAKKHTIPITFIAVFIIFIGKEVLNSLHTDNISQFAHIIGGILGSIFGFYLQK